MKFRLSTFQFTSQAADGNKVRTGSGKVGNLSTGKSWKRETVGREGGVKCTVECNPDIPGCFSRFGQAHSSAGHNRVVATDISSSFRNEVPMLWAEKHKPTSLSEFSFCHRSQAAFLKKLISQGNCPNLIFQGSPGAGKKALVWAILNDIFGDLGVKTRNKSFIVQDKPSAKINLPVSTHHVEINLTWLGDLDKDVLPVIIKHINLGTQMACDNVNGSSYKVLVLHNAEKLSQDAQQLLPRLMDRYGDTCKMIFCCNENSNLSDAIKSRCHIIDVPTPSFEETVQVLYFTARKENLELPKLLAARIAQTSKSNLRQAIVSLEACKNYQHPLVDTQPVQMGYWEEDVIEVAADIVTEPTPKRLFIVRAKMETLLANCVPPGLILQKLLEELLYRIDLQLKKDTCCCASYYYIRLGSGTDAIYQLEAFVAKFMSIYKKHLNTVGQNWPTVKY